MSRKVDPKTLKVGDKVRVKRDSEHGIKFGAVCEVIDIAPCWGPQVRVLGPIIPDEDWGNNGQWVWHADLLTAS